MVQQVQLGPACKKMGLVKDPFLHLVMFESVPEKVECQAEVQVGQGFQGPQGSLGTLGVLDLQIYHLHHPDPIVHQGQNDQRSQLDGVFHLEAGCNFPVSRVGPGQFVIVPDKRDNIPPRVYRVGLGSLPPGKRHPRKGPDCHPHSGRPQPQVTRQTQGRGFLNCLHPGAGLFLLLLCNIL